MPHQSEPLVSVCIPTYNGEKFLVECLASIRNQDYPNLEILVVDDDSIDSTRDRAQQFFSEDRRFRLARNDTRLGLVNNWNRCVALSRGKWIKFVFQDDIIHRQCISRLVANAEATNSPLVTCKRDFIFESGTSEDTKSFYLRNAAEIDAIFLAQQTMTPRDFARLVLKNITANVAGEPTSTLINRDLFSSIGYFNAHLAMCCDTEYWSRAGTNFGISYVPETLASFRVHAQSTSAANFGRKRFRMDFIDPLVVASEFLHNSHYAKLRTVADDCFGRRYLSRLCRDLARKAYSEVQAKSALRQSQADEYTPEWDLVCRQYPWLPRLAQPPSFFEKIAEALF